MTAMINESICQICGEHRSRFIDIVLAIKNGFVCDSCRNAANKANHEVEKKEALEAFAEANYDGLFFIGNFEIVCPHCALIIDNDSEFDDKEDIVCNRCDGAFSVEREHTITYSTIRK